MKLKEKKEYRSKTLKELQVALKEAQKQLFDLRMEQAQRKLKNTRSLFHLKKDIARIMTYMKVVEAHS